jgi:hypothetical protein
VVSGTSPTALKIDPDICKALRGARYKNSHETKKFQPAIFVSDEFQPMSCPRFAWLPSPKPSDDDRANFALN